MNVEKQGGAVRAAITWPGYVLGVYALICGVSAILSASTIPHGWAFITRPVLGCVGVMAGLMLLLRDGWWKLLLQLWLLAQVAVVIVDLSGPLTAQSGLHITCVRYGGSTSVGPELQDFTGWGVDFGALILLVLVWVIMAKRWYPVDAGRWLNGVAGVLKIVFLVAALAGGVYACLRWAKPLLNRDALMVIDSPPPGAEVYLKDKLLGSTPLAVTQENLVEWGLSKTDAAKKCTISLSPLQNILLQGASGTGELLFKPPAWLAADYVTMPTTWGIRGVTPIRNYYTSNYWSVPLLSNRQPGLLLDRPVIEPSDCRPGERIKIAVQMWRNADDPRAVAPPPKEQVLSAQLSVLFWKQINSSVGGYSTTNLELPPAWTHLAVGQTVSNVVTVTAPSSPGIYTIRLNYLMMGATNRVLGYGFNPYSSFGLLNVK